jgi:hypothetical protein
VIALDDGRLVFAGTEDLTIDPGSYRSAPNPDSDPSRDSAVQMPGHHTGENDRRRPLRGRFWDGVEHRAHELGWQSVDYMNNVDEVLKGFRRSHRMICRGMPQSWHSRTGGVCCGVIGTDVSGLPCPI